MNLKHESERKQTKNSCSHVLFVNMHLDIFSFELKQKYKYLLDEKP